MTNFQQRELELSREIANAFLRAQHPLELYRLALAQTTPLIDASFASVFLIDDNEPDLLKLVCAHNWPQSSARYLGQLRIRVGRGPTGHAVERNAAVEVGDVFADPALRDWWEPAKELGFASLISLPLEREDKPAGALTFYYAQPHEFSDTERHALQLIATQLSAMGERAQQAQDLRAQNEQLRHENEMLHARVGEAEEARRLKNEFLANMSHELRTPLTSILGYTYLLRNQIGNFTAEQENALTKIDGSANALLHLINDLLELTQLKLGREDVSAGPEDAVLLGKRAAEMMAAPTDDVTFRLLAMPDRIPIQTDGEKVLKILENLLSNAHKFTRSGEVSLTIRQTGPRNGRRVEWTVKDTGIGIAPEQHEHVFDEFRQVDGSSTRLYGGTGLGLALSLGLARLLGGEIVLESEIGQGSTFVLRLPLEYSGPHQDLATS
ncbi:MAG TPA: ATP-binding protein [Longimicrobiales bacterium]|nr:ATP-binding protein [Longimicrobiales bacterium]